MEPPSTEFITILNETGRTISSAPLAYAMSIAFAQHGRPKAKACLLLTSEEKVRDLNREFRGIDESTDVLTFPAGDFADGQLGDVAIAVPYAARQANVRAVSLDQELGFLAIHGALHLLGLDDQSELERAEMVRQMNLVAVASGLEPDEEWASLLHGDQA
jgi:rRNA maturation RNase YbeY